MNKGSRFLPAIKSNARVKSADTGFTLVEALISLAIMAILGLIIAGILTRTFRGGTKTELIGDIKQNGQNALNTIDSAIRNSNKIICLGSADTDSLLQGPIDANGDSIPDNINTIIVKQDGPSPTYTRIRFYNRNEFKATAQNNNGFISIDNPTVNEDMASEYCASAMLSNSIKITNSDNIGGISINNGKFEKKSEFGQPDIITVDFYGSAGVNSSGRYEQSVGIKSGTLEGLQFKTSIVQRYE